MKTFPYIPDNGVFFIAEAGVNHNGDLEQAKELVRVAAKAGANAVKFQIFDPDELVSDSAPLADYQKKKVSDADQHAMLQKLTLPRDAFRVLAALARECGIECIVTPFDIESARFLQSIGLRILKLPSGELTNLPFLSAVADLGLSSILSTGMSNLDEIETAIRPFMEKGTPLALLHCVSSYPAPPDQINLRAMKTLRERFGLPTGYSDHTEGVDVSIAAAALGAQIIEKHFTLDRTLPGPDHEASLEPQELTSLIQSIRIVEQALGTSDKQCQPCEINTRDAARRSVIATVDIPAGNVISNAMLECKRPGIGIPPSHIDRILNKKTTSHIAAGTLLTWSHFK